MLLVTTQSIYISSPDFSPTTGDGVGILVVDEGVGDDVVAGVGASVGVGVGAGVSANVGADVGADDSAALGFGSLADVAGPGRAGRSR